VRSRTRIVSTQNEAPASTLAAVRVLVVDDNALVRTVLTTLLESYEATVPASGRQPRHLRVLPLERPDVLVTDLSMLEADRFSLIRQVRALSPEDGGRTPAALVTRKLSSRMRQSAWEICEQPS
jgi:CheY-like chemotaxis protein